jgi:hypothetical protein
MEPLRKHTGKHSVLTSDAEIDAAIANASIIADEPRVVDAAYVSAEGLDSIVLKLSDNRRKLIPREEIQGLCDAPPGLLNNIEISPNGTSLRWPFLDIDLYVPPLLEGVVGNREWMKHLGRRGGLATTQAKAIASRLNGRKGGRPRNQSGEKNSGAARLRRVARNSLDDLNYVLFSNVTAPDIFKQYQALRGQGQQNIFNGPGQPKIREEVSYEAFSNSNR